MRELIHKWSLILLILLLPTQTAIHFWFPFSFVEGLRVDYLSPTLYLTDILIYIILIVYPPKISFFKKKFIPVLILINILYSLSPVFTLFKYAKFIILGFFGIYIIQNHQTFETTFKKYFPVAVIWSGVLAILQFINQGSLGGALMFLGERPLSLAVPNIAKISLGNFGLFLRAYSTFSHPNALAGFLFVSFWLLWRFVKSKVTFVALLVLLLAVLTSFSRSVFLVFSLSFVIYSLVKKSRLAALLFVLLLSIGVYFLLSYGSDVSFIERNFLIRKSLALLFLHPLTGVGLGNFSLAPSVGNPGNAFLIFQPVHNIYLLLLSELGIPFALIMFWYFYKIIQKGIARVNSETSIAVLGILVLGMVDHYWLTSHQNTLLLVVLVALYIVRSTAKRNE